MKPKTNVAMCNLITQIRETLPFDYINSDICSDVCSGCSVKLMEFLAIQLDDWEYKLEQGEMPNFGDINKLSKIAMKIHRVLINNKTLAL